MTDASVFQFQSYKDYLRSRIAGKENRGVLSRFADAMNCQRSYLSRVLSSEIHLTPDHAFRACEFWGLVGDAREYFLTMVDLERAAGASYQKFLKEKLRKLRAANEDMSARAKRPLQPSDASLSLYHSSWHWCAVHVLTSVPGFQTPEAISKRLGLPAELVLSALEYLANLGYVKSSKGKWVYATGETHIKKSSVLLPIFHQNWRLRAVQDSLNPETDGVHFSNVQSLSDEDFARLKQMLADFIENCMKISSPSRPEEVVAFTFDLFRL